MATLLEQIANIQTLIDNLEALAFGDDTTSVTHDGQTRDSLSKAIKGKFDALQAMVQGRLTFETKAQLDAHAPTADANGQYPLAEVWGDAEDKNNGMYSYSGSVWSGNEFDPLKYAREGASKSDLVLNMLSADQRSNRDSLPGYLWSVVDAIGRVAIAIDKNANVSMNGIVLSDVAPYRDSDTSAFSMKTSAGQLIMKVNSSGSVEISELLVSGFSYPRDTGEDDIYSVRDLAGNKVLTVTSDGRLNFLPGKSVTDNVVSSMVASDREMSELPYFNFRRINDAESLATVCDSDRCTFDVRNVDGFSLVDDRRPVIFLPVGGQSNSGQGGSTGVSYDGSPYPHHCATFLGRNAAYGANGLIKSSDVEYLQSLSDSGNSGQFPATMIAFSMEHFAREYGFSGPGVIAWTSWYGGEPIETFLRGTDTWENLMVGAAAAKSVAEKFNRSVSCPAYVFIQGETGSPGYSSTLQSYASDVVSELKSVLGISNTPDFIYMQINSGDTAVSPNSIESDQLSVARLSLPGVYLAGPMYQCPLGDTIHQSPEGRMIVGETVAACMHEIEKTGGFEPLWPVSCVLNADVITVTFNKALSIDTDWVPSVGNLGFTYSDDSGSSDIQSVAVAGNVCTIQLTSAPTGANPRIEYAMLNGVDSDGWANGIGNIYSESGHESLFSKLGFQVPKTVRHYSVRFKEML